MSDLQLLVGAIAALLAALGFRAFKNKKNSDVVKDILNIAQEQLEKQNVQNEKASKEVQKSIEKSEAEQKAAVKEAEKADKQAALKHWNKYSFKRDSMV